MSQRYSGSWLDDINANAGKINSFSLFSSSGFRRAMHYRPLWADRPGQFSFCYTNNNQCLKFEWRCCFRLSPLEGSVWSRIWTPLEGRGSSRRREKHALRQPAGLGSTLKTSFISGRQTLQLWRPDVKIILPFDASYRDLSLCHIHYSQVHR